MGKIDIPLLETESREPNEIIGICLSKCEYYVAVVTGKNLVMKEQKQNQLFIFKKIVPKWGKRNTKRGEQEAFAEFELVKRVRVKELPIFNKVTMQFFFKNKGPLEEPNTLIFCKRDCIFTFNYMKEEISVVYEIEHKLDC